MPTFTSDANDNILTGSSGVDILQGLGGNDILIENGGADMLQGGDGLISPINATRRQASS